MVLVGKDWGFWGTVGYQELFLLRVQYIKAGL